MNALKKLAKVTFPYKNLIFLGSFGSVYKIRRKSDNEELVWKELDYGRMTDREKQQVVSEISILS